MHGIDESNKIERNSICPWLERVTFDVMGFGERWLHRAMTNCALDPKVEAKRT